MRSDQTGDHKKEENKGAFDYILASIIFFCAAVTSSIGRIKERYDKEGGAADLAKWTAVVGWWTRILAGVGVITAAILAVQSCILFNQWQEMREEYRPWIYAEGASLASSFTFAKKGAISLRFELTNVGKSPAQFVNINGNFSYISFRNTSDIAGIYAKLKICDEMRGMRLPGDTVFPNQHTHINHIFVMKEIDADKWEHKMPNEIGGLFIIGCVDYVFADGGAHHQSRFVYQLERRGPTIDTFLPVVPVGTEIAASQLTLADNPYIAKTAD